MNRICDNLEFGKMNLAISFNLVGKGWAVCVISLNEEKFFLNTSFLEDALGNLAEATLELVKGEKMTFATFLEEPDEFIVEYRWKLSSINDNEILVEILWFDEWREADEIEREGKTILHFRCEQLFFAKKIIKCLDEVLDENGLEGYKKMCLGREFPFNAYNELKSIYQK